MTMMMKRSGSEKNEGCHRQSRTVRFSASQLRAKTLLKPKLCLLEIRFKASPNDIETASERPDHHSSHDKRWKKPKRDNMICVETREEVPIESLKTLELSSEAREDKVEDEYDSDVEPPCENVLLWRLDPDESLSDWTIEIVTPNQTTAYHVHKAHLAAGWRKSEYFRRLFQNDRFAESQSNTSRIELQELAANAFPDLLDYLYTNEQPLNITMDNATALHALGNYFEMRRLRWEAKQFWRKNLTPATCDLYYEHATVLQDETVHQVAAEMCAKHILTLDPSSRLVHVPDPNFWLQLLETSKITTALSLHVSKLIVAFCQNIPVDGHTFLQLTDEKYLPQVDVPTAVQLLVLEQEIVKPDPGHLSNLQKRCISVLAKEWKELDLREDLMVTALPKLNPLVLTELLSQTLNLARDRLASESSFQDKLTDSLVMERAKSGNYARDINRLVRLSSLHIDDCELSESSDGGPKMIGYDKEGVVYTGNGKEEPVFYYICD